MTEFVKEGPDKRGKTHIIEGEKGPGKVFKISRFICEVCEQETPAATQKVADMLLEKLNGKEVVE